METTIYRTGKMSVAAHSESVFLNWAEFDMRRPVGHVSRSQSLFASPDLYGAHEWLHYMAVRHPLQGQQLVFNEVTVESDNVRVYNIEDYDLVGFHGGKPAKWQLTHIDDYWNNSMTLTQWKTEQREDHRGRWEILLPVSEVISARPLTYSELRNRYEENWMDWDLLDELETEIKPVLEPVCYLTKIAEAYTLTNV